MSAQRPSTVRAGLREGSGRGAPGRTSRRSALPHPTMKPPCSLSTPASSPPTTLREEPCDGAPICTFGFTRDPNGNILTSLREDEHLPSGDTIEWH